MSLLGEEGLGNRGLVELVQKKEGGDEMRVVVREGM